MAASGQMEAAGGSGGIVPIEMSGGEVEMLKNSMALVKDAQGAGGETGVLFDLRGKDARFVKNAKVFASVLGFMEKAPGKTSAPIEGRRAHFLRTQRQAEKWKLFWEWELEF
jgi:hypothetical protein